ncbi:hypothetical protein F7725_020571 [Dissostichus mawsoni]|uniref:non-specific serine/threonine protein kinase n=1 Tax=Dissostichus mawsoni TaxID=36200 RepID=A0A7J5YEJ5_DISMA|nr:hypothetical protein F7725_020571 [Dissostichus mawsoni]
MEYAPGGTLADYIQKRCNSLLDEDTILHFFVQILLALYHVHNKLILHRDLKTQNILLDKHQMIVKIGCRDPCYISPELCEGKPYNQKSDIWALGCVLYELASLKRAFEAANLPALVLKIMSGTFAPISDRYSPELRQLILHMLNLDPSKRPQLNEIMALPVCIRPLLNLYTDIGNVKMRRIEKPLSSMHTGPQGRQGGRVPTNRSRDGSVGLGSGKVHSLLLSSVYTWGSGISAPLRLPMLNTEVLQVSLGRTQRMGVTKSGRLITWEAPSVGSGEAGLPGVVEQMQPQFISRFLEGQSGVTIKSVSCGDLFTTCMTGWWTLLIFITPKIVEALLGYELVQMSCGASHVVAVTNEREVFAWGRGDNGRLGLGTQDSHNCPRQVCLPVEFEAQRVICGVDCSMIISTQYGIVACGSNRFNKLGLDIITAGEEPNPSDQLEEVNSYTHVQSAPLDSEKIIHIDIGTAHSVAVTERGECFTFGSNQHGQMGCSSRRSSRVPYLVPGLQGITMAACGDAFTLAIGSGE